MLIGAGQRDHWPPLVAATEADPQVAWAREESDHRVDSYRVRSLSGNAEENGFPSPSV